MGIFSRLSFKGKAQNRAGPTPSNEIQESLERYRARRRGIYGMSELLNASFDSVHATAGSQNSREGVVDEGSEHEDTDNQALKDEIAVGKTSVDGHASNGTQEGAVLEDRSSDWEFGRKGVEWYHDSTEEAVNYSLLASNAQSTMCYRCKSTWRGLDDEFYKYFKDKSKDAWKESRPTHPHPWGLGTNIGRFSEINENRSCPICRLVVEAYERCVPRQRRAVERSHFFLTWHPTPLRPSPGKERRYHLRASLGFSSDPPGAYGALIPVGRDPESSTGLARATNPNQIDFGLVRHWVHCCQTWHGGACSGLMSEQQVRLRNTSSFYLVDVIEQCIVPQSVMSRYIALSYVWGSKPLYVTRKSEVNFLRHRGSLRILRESLSLTIRDAMDLVEAVGERFLWVDCLCIVQDDSEIQDGQIKIMDLIYSNAFFTIMAATGDNADAGLPGVRWGSRGRKQLIEQLSPGERLAFVPDWVASLATSAYESRGWTFQEQFTSRRRLFFIEGQIIFQCNSMTWKEDVYAEDPSVPTHISYFRGVPYRFSRVKRQETASDFRPLQDYNSTLAEYSLRKITFDTDALRAFEGVANILAVYLNTDFFYGMPVSMFDRVFLWRSPGPQRRRVQFASWSWAGFEGSKYVPGALKDTSAALARWLRLHTWIKWSFLDERSEWTPLMADTDHETSQLGEHQNLKRTFHHPYWNTWRVPDVDDSLMEQSPPFRLSRELKSLPWRGSTTSVCKRPRLLRFWTLSVRYRIGVEIAQGHQNQLKIFDVRNLLVGRLDHMNNEAHATLQEIRKLNNTGTEFLVLSETRFPKPSHLSLSSDLYDPRNISSPESEQDIPDKKFYDAYNVMLIQWCKDDVAERLALGILMKTALVHSISPGPIWKEVVLG